MNNILDGIDHIGLTIRQHRAFVHKGVWGGGGGGTVHAVPHFEEGGGCSFNITNLNHFYLLLYTVLKILNG